MTWSIEISPIQAQGIQCSHSSETNHKILWPIQDHRKNGSVASRLQFPPSALMHNVFHVSHLKEHLGKKAIPQQDLPLVTADGHIKYERVVVLDTRVVSHGDSVVTSVESLMVECTRLSMHLGR